MRSVFIILFVFTFASAKNDVGNDDNAQVLSKFTANNTIIAPKREMIKFVDTVRINTHHIKRRRSADGKIHFVEDPSPSEGSLCRRKYDNSGGYCISINRCLYVLREYRRYGVKIDVCTFDGKTPIVCCPFEKMSQMSAKKRIHGRVSAEKCDEYSKLTTTTVSFLPLIVNTGIFKFTVPKCDYDIPLIVGGQVTNPGEFPHMAAIGWKRNNKRIDWLCGGSLISENFVLTAAHCTNSEGKPPNVVRLGEQNLHLDTDGANPQDIHIAKIIKYPRYKTSSYYDDIALIKLQRSPKFNIFVRPACLWQFPKFNFTQVTATGWGKTEFAGKASDELQKVVLSIINNTICNKFFDNERKLRNGIIDTQFCAGFLTGEKDTCQGDSGGPIQLTLKGNKCLHYIIGITSFGKFCAAPNSPGVYTKIYPYLDWIEEIAFGFSTDVR